MKTYHLKDILKKDLLIVELPENGYYEEYRDGIEVRDFLTDEVLTLANYILLGSPNEIKEEDVKDLVEKITTRQYKNYGYVPHYFQYLLSTALESFNSALEKEILWENPIKIPSSDDINWFRNQRDGDFSERYTRVLDWYNNQEKTFDKKRVKIFVKN